jgi:cell division protease FtsH
MNAKKSVLFWVLGLVSLAIIFDVLQGGFKKGAVREVAFSEFMQAVESGQVKQAMIRGPLVEAEYSAGEKIMLFAPDYPGLVDALLRQNVRVEAAPIESASGSWIGILISWFPVLLLIGVWIFFMRQMQGGGSKGMGFGRARTRVYNEKSTKITFADVAGIEESKADLEEIVSFLKDPGKFQALGGKIPRGCLLIGSPGTGKTLLARAVAGEAGVPFYSISGSDFVEMFVGVGASRVRDLFEQAKRTSPCLVFIDEIDAVGRHRGAGMGGGNDEREQTLNQLLVEMDGFEENQGVIIIAATNRPDVLDPALLRPGRFDRQIIVPLPDIKGREQILAVHLKRVPQSPDVDTKIIARGTPGFSGADLANLVNEAALLAARRNRKVVSIKELEEAKDKVMMGAERRSMVMDENERRLTAYHESGHAIVAIYSPASDPIHKATIIPRGRALGLVMRLPERDTLSYTLERLLDDLAVAMGGRVAEELIFGRTKVTSGASSDIKQATQMARRMVTEWGMSDKIGPLYHGAEQQEVFLGHSLGQQRNTSDATAELIDEEVKKLVVGGYDRAKQILSEHSDDLEKLAQALLEYETLSGDEIKSVLAGQPLGRGGAEENIQVRRSSLPTDEK